MIKSFIKKFFLDNLSDRHFLQIMYRYRMGKKLDLKNPITYNEKLQWLKLYDRNPLYTTLVDKYEVKNWVANKIGEEYIIPTLAVYDKAEQIDFNSLPNQYVLKCTHNSGGIVICKDNASGEFFSREGIILTKEQAIELLNKNLADNYFYYKREWPYKNVKPRIIAEKFMQDESGYELKDYKFLCFDGEAKASFIAKGRSKNEVTFDFFDTEFNHLPIKQGHPNSNEKIKKPINYEKMVEKASILSKDIPHVRVDLYNCNGKIYFGEMTMYHFSGMMPFEPNEWDKKFGEWIDLNLAHINKNKQNTSDLNIGEKK